VPATFELAARLVRPCAHDRSGGSM